MSPIRRYHEGIVTVRVLSLNIDPMTQKFLDHFIAIVLHSLQQRCQTWRAGSAPNTLDLSVTSTVILTFYLAVDELLVCSMSQQLFDDFKITVHSAL